jgi:hypothetical protein
MRDLLQAAMSPTIEQAWVERLVEAPERAMVRAALAPYAEALDLVHPELPAMQVRPTAEALAARGNGGGRAAAADGEEGEDEEAEPEGAQALVRLLPDVPTLNNDAKGTSFFARLGDAAVPPLAAGLVLPLFYANMVLFPSPGGGHFGLPAGIDTIKFAVVGDTLWRSLWANIATGDGKVPVGPRLFPWLDRRYRERPARKDPWFKDEANRLYPGALPPWHIPMPRRYLLGRPARATCAATGMTVPCFASFERWQNGPMYAPSGFRPVWASTRERTGGKATSGALDYRKASGPLRFDDWLEIGLGGAVGEGDKAGWSVPDTIVRFTASLDAIADALEQHGDLDAAASSALARELPFRVRATAMVVKGKAPIASSTRELPLWRPPADARQDLADGVAYVAAQVGKIAGLLADRAKACVKLAEGMKNPGVAAALEDALKAALDEAVVDLPRRLVRERDQARSATVGDEVVAEAVDAARRLFDETFPVTGVDRVSLAAARARRELLGKLRRLDPRRRDAGSKRRGRRKQAA